MEEERNEEEREKEREENTENSDSENNDNREEETVDEIRDNDYVNDDEIRDNDYVNDDEIEMLRKIEERLNSFDAKFDAIMGAVSMFVDGGAIINENVETGDITEDDFAEEFLDIEDLDFSID